ncbi:PiggyBac transposable element-derived protein 4 [Cucumispora dikerogammari]|nr:PiggyBac transposable element-derived protein 4 [Cucumispora dikerogammari]
MVHNTYVLYKTFSKEENKINTHLDFRMACIRYVLEESDGETISNIQRKKLEIKNNSIHFNSRLVKKHFPNKIQNKKYKISKECAKSRQRKQTLTFCPVCDVALCIAPCIRERHEDFGISESSDSTIDDLVNE